MPNAYIQNIGYLADSKVLSFEYCNRYKNIVTTMLERAKQNYFTDRFNDAIANTRETWRLLTDLINNVLSKKMEGFSKIKLWIL